MRTLAIGDIHGCYNALAALEAYVAFEAEDRIITLGDYVDRGPDTKQVLEWLIHRDSIGNLVALRGNHELMMIAARDSKFDFEDWFACGGSAVLDSYEVSNLDELPDKHWDFLLSRLLPYYETKTHFFVHANASPDLPLPEQPEFMLYWEQFGDPPPHESGRTMICGHTSQRSGKPLDVGHATCIDTSACRGGWLTCLDVDTRFCWQANESGDIRCFWLNEGPSDP